ncbi:MAG: rhodanese-like domain-containing protein, partial [Burkholderiales bacterium]|nr:rhodanese-like domain-containing protein [Burkholderiales bacterium]
VKQYVDIPPRKDVVLIDARPAARQYDNGHLPGAINIPDSQFDKMTNRLPADKNMLVIVYCGGLECMLSHNVAHKMEKLGYTNIKVYAEGNPAWSKAGLPLSVSTVFVKKLFDDKEKFMLIDSRPKRVFGQGAIPGAVNIPDSEFDKNVSQLPADKSTFLVFYCGGLECNLSDKSADKARALGYTNVKTYAEGYPGWGKAYPEMKTAAAADAGPAPVAAKQAVDIVPGKEKGSITNASFEKLVKETPDAVLFVDVRDAKEFARGHLKGAVNIPIGELDKKLASLPTDKPVIFLCSTGGRSGEAYDTVKLLRAEVQAYFVDAEITFAADGSYQLKGKS